MCVTQEVCTHRELRENPCTMSITRRTETADIRYVHVSPRVVWLQPWRCIVCLLLAMIVNSQGFSFFMNSSSNGLSCGHLECVAGINQTGNLPFLSLAIYNVTGYEDKVTLASVSELDPHVHLGQNLTDAINATGGIYQHQAGVVVELKLELDCSNGSFVCELMSLNGTGQSDVITRHVLP